METQAATEEVTIVRAFSVNAVRQVDLEGVAIICRQIEQRESFQTIVAAVSSER